jgi:predicted lipoprotein with Yx(FWY)xxD motif
MRVIKGFMMMLLTVAAGTLLFVSASSAAGLSIKNKDGIGAYLTDEKGMTLYLFKKDSSGQSACASSSGCLEKWPVFFAEKIEAVEGIDVAGIGVITREDGKKQNTYKGLPLYYFFKDKAPGDTLGQGVNNVWYVVAP